MLEIAVNLHKHELELAFQANSIIGGPPSELGGIRLQGNRISKRLLLIKKRSRIYTYIPKNFTKLNLTHFKLIKVTKNFFVSRMLKKLGWDSESNKESTNFSDKDIDLIFNSYNALFIKRIGSIHEYELYIRDIEGPQIPTNKEQLELLKKWGLSS
jgi:hypothetical protein